MIPILETNDWAIGDASAAKGTTPDEDRLDYDELIPPPSPFRVSVTCSEGDNSKSYHSMSNKTISSDLKKEIELSLLHWPSNTEPRENTYRSLGRRPKHSKTLPKRVDNAPCLSLPGRYVL